MNKVVIIGGGIIGCSLANELVERGHKVIVLEAGKLCKESSWAAAGMLAPFAELAHSVPESLHKLMLKSYYLYSDFVKNLESETGVQTNFRETGSLMLAMDFQESKLLAGLLERVAESECKVEEFTAAQIQKMQSGLNPKIESGLFFPEDKYVNPQLVCKALIKKASKAGVLFRSSAQVSELKTESGKISEIIVNEEPLEADAFVVTAGAWTGSLLKSLDLKITTRPIRGQIVELEVAPQRFNQLIHTSGCYIVPWPDGRTLVGATMENVGFDKRVTAEGLNYLLETSTKAVPALKIASVKRSWSGLRPDTFDVAVECSGNAFGYADAMRFLGKGGHLAQMGLAGKDCLLPTDLICFKEMTITSGFASNPRSWQRAMKLMHSGKLDLESLVSEVVPLTEWKCAFDRSFAADGIKFVIDPRMDEAA